MKKIYCVLRSGGKDYDERHVRWLKRQCDEYAPGVDFICLTDLQDGIDGVETHPLIHHWPGWWSKIELFRYDDVFYLDLDTVLLNDIRYMLDLEGFHALRNFGGYMLQGRVVMGSGIMSWSRSYRHVYDNFDIRHIDLYARRQNRWGDQGYIHEQVRYNALQDAFPGKIHSYKFDGIDRANPPGDIVCFHGNPRPWDSGQGWVPPLVP
jgi:hypothetical protein